MPKKRGNGEGSVYHTKDGRWRASVLLPDGARKYVSGDTRKEAAEELAKVLATAARGGSVASNRILVDGFLDSWLRDEVEGSVRYSTYVDYASIVKLHLKPILGKKKLTQLNPDDIARLHKALADKGLSAGRILKVHRVLSKALKVAQRWGYVDRNVAELVTPPRAADREMEYLTKEEVKKLITAIHGRGDESRWLLALLGLRQGEALGLRWRDVDLEAGTLTIRVALQRQKGKGLVLVEPKSTSSRRTLHLYPDLVNALKARKAAQAKDRLRAGNQWADTHDLVFTDETGHAIDAGHDHDAWEALLKRAELRDVRLHDARHTAATLLLLSGVPLRAAMEWLGHSQVSQTMRYTHVAPEVSKDTGRKLGDTLFGA